MTNNNKSSNEARKILFLITQAEMGGAQKYVLELASAFAGKGYSVSVGSEKNEVFESKLLENNVSFHEIKHLKRSVTNPFSNLAELLEIYKLIKKEKPDLVHLNSSKMGLLGAIAGKLSLAVGPLKKMKIVFTAHGWVFNEVLPFWKKWIFIFLSWFAALFQDEIICVSSHDKKRALKYKVASEKKLHVVNNGIDSESVDFLNKKEAREKLNLPQEKVVVGTVANFYKTKGLKYFARAAAGIKKERKDVLFVVMGDGPERENLEEEIKKYKLENDFLLLGAVKNAAQYLKALDVFVLPSEKEGFPYALLEAGLARVPLVTTNVGGISDLINDENGVLILSRSSRQIKAAILNLLENKEKQKLMSESLHRKVLENFNFKKMVEETENIYF